LHIADSTRLDAVVQGYVRNNWIRSAILVAAS
jgi:hypothetical protein